MSSEAENSTKSEIDEVDLVGGRASENPRQAARDQEYRSYNG